jgi:DNA polymerase-1
MAGTTDVALTLVDSLEEAMNFKRWLGERRPFLAIDTETGGFDWWRDRLRTVQFGDRHHGWCIEYHQWRGLIEEALTQYTDPIVMHNSKFDTHFLEVNGLPVKRWLVHDSRTMAHLVAAEKLTGLKPLAGRILGPWARHGEDEMKLAMSKGGFTFDTIPVDLLWKYAAFDTVLTAQVAEELYPTVMNKYEGIYGLEIAATQVLTDMERRGLLVDRQYLERVFDEWGMDMAALTQQIKHEWMIERPTSRSQVIKRLQEDGVQFVEFTDKGNPKLDEDVLEALEHPLARLVSRLFSVTKDRNTYIKNLLELADDNNKIHASINPLGARTGRMSVSRPSLQNLPATNGRIRNAFISPIGETLISADYDQIEMRIFAHYSQDKAMLAAIRYGDEMTALGHPGYDLHSMNARLVYHIAMDAEVPKEFRKKVKGSGFAKVYGSGLATFAASTGQSMSEAQATLTAYDTAFPGVQRFQRQITQVLNERGRMNGDAHLTTAYGRREPCLPTDAYKGVNYLCQGTAADVLKERLVALSRTWLGEFMLLPIHDEILFQVPDDIVPDAMEVIKQVMPVNDRFLVPLTVDTEAAKRWGAKYD